MCYDFGSLIPDLEWDVHAAPLVQIFSVHLSTEFYDGEPCQVYGLIRATQGQSTSFDLYDRDLADCETICKHGSLSVTGPQGSAISGSKGVNIDFHLKDKIRGIELTKGQHYLDSIGEDSCDKLMKAVVQGEHGCVYLYYTTFRFAVSADVEVAIVNKGDGSGRFDDVYGSLAAYYSNNKQYCKSDDEVKYLKISLFEKPSDKPVRVDDGDSS